MRMTEIREVMRFPMARIGVGLRPPTALSAVICAAGAALLLLGCGNKTVPGAPGLPPGGMMVQEQVVKTVTIPDSAEDLSVLKWRPSAHVNPQLDGQITTICMQSTDRVST